MSSNCNTAERETLGLCICMEAVRSIASAALFDLSPPNASTGETTAYFRSRTEQHLFLIRLLDFTKEGGDAQVTGVRGSYLEVLKAACSSRSFDTDGSIGELERSIQAMEDWLAVRRTITLPLPTLNVEAKIDVSRIEFLRIAGNQSKHNLSRLTGVTRDVVDILRRHGHAVSQELALLALDDFAENLSDNYFIYYGTWLAELSNNIQWGIRTYLQPTFDRSIRREPDGLYRYEYPAQIHSDIAKKWFWRLMNHIRGQPGLRRFTGSSSLKDESSLEWSDDRSGE